MTHEQRQHLERRLLEERARVIGSLDQYRTRKRDTASDEAGDVSHYPYHLADEGTDTMEGELGASEAARETRELTEIDDALRRLYHEPQRFGKDERTGGEIPFERLDIIPWARTAADASAR
jgi:RNA polymerase-binding transcription factor DksA